MTMQDGLDIQVPQPALLFDLDGTLVDSVYQHVIAWQEALATCGIELSVWRIHRRIVPTIEPPGFEVGHFFITSRSRLPIGSGDLGSVVVLFAAMSKSETVVRGTNVRCSTCRHIQWVPVDKTAFACERCDAQLTRR